MSPIRTYTNWNRRPSDQRVQIEPFRKYYFICEGANTETWYFRKLIGLRKELGIHPTIDIRLLEKTEKDKNISYPLQLIRFADMQKKTGDFAFDSQHDRMIVVFDADIFEQKVDNYHEVLAEGERNNILGITNPSFELFLLLHYENAFQELIMPHYDEILRNDKIGNMRFIYKLLHDKSGINSKHNQAIGELAANIDTAIEQERMLNQNIHDCKGKLTSNIGQIIETIRSDRGVDV